MKRVAIAAVFAAIFAVSSARADDQTSQAKALFEAGAQAYEAGNYVAAAQAFQQAYDVVPKPAILFSIAQAERKQFYVDHARAHLTRALDLYRKYLSQVPQGGRRDDAVQALADIDSVQRSLGPATPHGADDDDDGPVAPRPKSDTRISIYSLTHGGSILIDGRPYGTVPSSPDVAPGHHHVTVTLAGYATFERDVDVREGNLAPVDATLVPKPAQVLVVAPDGAQVTVDGRPVGTLPMAAPMEVPAGRHFVTIALGGHEPTAMEIEVQRGEYKQVRTGLKKTTQRQASAWVLFGAGAGVVAGASLTAIAVAKQSNATSVLDAAKSRNLGPADVARYDDQRSARDHYKTAAIATFGGAAALAVTGVLLYAFDDPPVKSAPALRDAPASTPTSTITTEIGTTPLVGPGFLGGSVYGRF